MTTKTVNYTQDQVEKLVVAYQSGQSVESIADGMGKSVRSVVAKLSREGVYQAKSYVSKTGERPVKKDLVADQIAHILDLAESEADSLTKANKTALVKILSGLQ